MSYVEQLYASDPVRVVSDRKADIRFFDGALPHGKGIWNYQVMRANRNAPLEDSSIGFTYNHAPMLCYWQGRLWVEYLSNAVSEHVPPSNTLLCSSEDGLNWSEPREVFPALALLQGVYDGPGSELLKPGDTAIMHQRMGFYISKAGRMYVLGFYGISPKPQISPNNGYGIARVIRRVHTDGSFSPIYAIRYNVRGGFTPEAISFPFYEEAGEDFRLDCQELLENRLVIRQWWEEQRFDQELFHKDSREAFCWYHASDGQVIGLYKHSQVNMSKDEGESWSEFQTCHSIGTSTGKMWGQRTSNGHYALIYNPSPDSMHRWPLAMATGEDGYAYGGLRAITPHVPPTRYEGWAKNLGPQYVRGICEGYPQPPDGHLWLTYSMNKEDIWVCRVFVPAVSAEEGKPEQEKGLSADLDHWNIYSPLWAPVRFEPEDACLILRDWDPYDKAIAERGFTPAAVLSMAMDVRVCKGDGLFIDLNDDRGAMPVRLCFREDGFLYAKANGVYHKACAYEQGIRYRLELKADCGRHNYTLSVSAQGQSLWEGHFRFCCAVDCLTRLVIQTKDRVNSYDLESNGKDGSMKDLPDAGKPSKEKELRLYEVQITPEEVLPNDVPCR